MAGTVVGVDIGAGAVRAVEVQGYDGGRPSITRYHELPLPESSVRRSEVVEIGTVTTVLRRRWSAGGFKARMSCSESEDSASSRATCPFRAAARSDSRVVAVPRQEQYLPVWVSGRPDGLDPIQEEQGERAAVTSCCRRAQGDHRRSVNAASSAGLRPVHVDLIPFAISRSSRPWEWTRKRRHRIDRREHHQCRRRRRRGAPIRPHPARRGDDVTVALASRMQWSPEQAEHAK